MQQIVFHDSTLAHGAQTCRAAFSCRKLSHDQRVRGHRRDLRGRKTGCAFSDPQDTVCSGDAASRRAQRSNNSAEQARHRAKLSTLHTSSGTNRARNLPAPAAPSTLRVPSHTSRFPTPPGNYSPGESFSHELGLWDFRAFFDW